MARDDRGAAGGRADLLRAAPGEEIRNLRLFADAPDDLLATG